MPQKVVGLLRSSHKVQAPRYAGLGGKKHDPCAGLLLVARLAKANARTEDAQQCGLPEREIIFIPASMEALKSS